MLLLGAGCALDQVGLAPDGSAAADASLDATVDAPQEGDAASPKDASDDAPLLDAPADDAADVNVPDAADAGPILTINGGTYDLLDPDAGLCSPSSSTSIDFQTVDDRDASIDLDWVSFQTSGCNDVFYQTIPSGFSGVQQTYVGHVWRVRDHASQSLLGEFRLTQAATYTVMVH